jgi:hypothetical protein
VGLDIRLPIGWLFVILGSLLTLFGIFGSHAIYDRSLGININLGWGLVMMAFGAAMVLLGYRGAGGEGGQ